MRWLDYSVFGMGALVVACGGAGADPGPGPVPTDLCAVEHSEGGIAVCDELYSEAPFVHLPAASETSVIAGLQGTSFVTADGKTYPYAGSSLGNDPEVKRHALALYELVLSGGTVKSFRPVILFDESMFVEPFMGHAFEGTISRRVAGQYALEASLPVRVEIEDAVVEQPSAGTSYQALATIMNADAAVTAPDGSCLPALGSYGSEAPFDAGVTVTLGASRAPWMHGFGDDEFVFDVRVDGSSVGSMMGATWYRGPIDLARGTLDPAGTYSGTGHGTPGYIPSLVLAPIGGDGGGEPCTAP